MKICNRCKQEKELSEFRVVKSIYYRGTCKKCEVIEHQESQCYTQDYVYSLKNECSICGYNKCKTALEFHHLNPQEKETAISILTKRRWSEHTKKLIDEEFEKCIVVCANCHREIHDNQ